MTEVRVRQGVQHKSKRRKLKKVVGIVIAIAVIDGLVAIAKPMAYADDLPCNHNHILVKFEPGTNCHKIDQINKKLGGELEDVIPGIDVYIITVPEGETAPSTVAIYSACKKVESAELDYIVPVP